MLLAVSLQICPACAEFRTADVGSPCPTCATTLISSDEPHLEGLVQSRLRRRIERWRQQGVIDRGTAARLIASLEALPTASSSKPAPVSASALETWADELAASIQRIAAWRPGWGAAFFQSLEEAAKAEREALEAESRRSDLGLAVGSGGSLFGHGGTGALGGLDSLVELDAAGGAAGKEGALKLHEYVWWFLGALLVLGGSIMGVREAWRALGGVPRQLIVTGALFVYHAGFIGLGLFLARRSLSAGRVLASIGLALMPVVFVALSALMALSPTVGLVGALVVTGLCLPTLRIAGRLLHGTSMVALAWALFPSLLAELPIQWLEDAPWPRALCAFVGVAALGTSMWRPERAGQGNAPLVTVGAALYGALALAIFSVAGAADGFDTLEPGSASFAGMALWAVALAGIIAAAAMGDSLRRAYIRAAPVVEVLTHAVVASGALAGTVAAFSLVPGVDLWVDVVSAFTPAAAALVFFLLQPRRPALVHLGALSAAITGFLLARLQAPEDVAWWFVGPAAVASGLLLIVRQCRPGSLRMWLLAWGVILSVASMLLVSMGMVIQGQWSAWPQLAAGTLVAVAAHLSAGHQYRSLHYLGGFAVPFAVFAALGAFPGLSSDWSTQSFLTLAGALYGIAGLVHAAWARRAGQSLELSPLDDLSLAAVSLGVLIFLGYSPDLSQPEPFIFMSGAARQGLAIAPLVMASALLLLRVGRDRSRAVSFLVAVSLIPVARMITVWGVPPHVSRIPALEVLTAALVLGFAVIAMLRGRGAFPAAHNLGAAGPRGRQVLGSIPLPFAETGRPLFTDGFASAALLLALLKALQLVTGISSITDDNRSLFLFSSGLLVVSAVLAFLTRGFYAWRLRGSVVALVAGGLLIVLTAIINRAGRPLPPDVAAWRMPLIGAGLWGLALVARRFGPWLGRRLENEPHGRLYHWVPHAGVAGLVLVLVVGAFRVGLPDPTRALGIVPPLMPLGAGLLALLLAASFRSRDFINLGMLLGLSGAALWAAQQSLLGPQLAPLVPPDGQWVRAEALVGSPNLRWLYSEAWMPPGATAFLLWQRAFAGVAAAGLVYAAVALVQAQLAARFAFLRRMLSWVPEELRETHAQSVDAWGILLLELLRWWAVLAVTLVFCAAFLQPGLTSAALTFATGAVLLLGRARAQGRVVLGVGLLLIVHAVAHWEPVVAAWPGPVLALLGLAVVSLAPWIARMRGLDEGQVRVRVHLAATIYAAAGTVYALATLGATHSSEAVPRLLSVALTHLNGRWMLSAAFPVTAALVAATVLVGAFQWKGALASLDAALGSALAGFSAICGLAVVLQPPIGEGWERPTYKALLTTYGAALALGAAGSAAAAHAAGMWLRERRRDVWQGLRGGRDVWLIGCGGLLTIVALLVRSPGADMLPQALAALGLAVIVALHCAWSEHTGRHVYFVQVAVVGVYAMVRNLYVTGLRPEHDALFALALGFALVGVTVMARRAGIPPVADATRRFAALLPLLMWWVLPAEATHQAALLAGGSGLLYAALGAVEHSRWFGSLAAAACNLALLIGALAFGLEGLEIYLAPVGLLLLMLGQLFASSIPQAARNAVRVLGGLLLYVPAAARLSLQVGLAEDGMYSVFFGGACLVGVMVGMLFHIRAYLALGTLFLTLDVVANLVHAGLRDHRVGFVVMTLTGLTIVSGRVLATLRRQQLELLMRRVRVELRGWD